MDLIVEAYRGMKGMPSGIPSEKELEPFVDSSQCYEYAQGVSDKFPQLHYDAGFYVKGGKPHDHAWTIHSNGTIVDTTASQFGKNAPMIVPPDHPHHSRYVSYERHEIEAQKMAHMNGDHQKGDSGSVDICPHCNPSK